MKKIIIFALTLFIGLTNIKAISPTVEYIPSIYANKKGDRVYSGQLGYIKINDKLIYCIDPFKIIGNDYWVHANPKSVIPEEELRYMQAVAITANKYFKEQNDVKIYMAAQELIWEKIIGNGSVSWTTELNEKGNRIGIDSYKELIKPIVNDFMKRPSFDTQIIEGDYYSKIVIEDFNKTLDQYEIIRTDSKNIVYKQDNKLYIEIRSDKLEEIKFVRKIGIGEFKIYTNGGSNQMLADLDTEATNVATLKIRAINENNSNCDIHFVDKKTKELIKENVSFEINGNEYNTTNGKYLVNLKVGEYELKTTNVPKNYIIPENYKINILEDELEENRNYYIELEKLEFKEIKKEELPKITPIKNIKTLPNTCNYISYIKLFLITMICILKLK